MVDVASTNGSSWFGGYRRLAVDDGPWMLWVDWLVLCRSTSERILRGLSATQSPLSCFLSDVLHQQAATEERHKVESATSASGLPPDSRWHQPGLKCHHQLCQRIMALFGHAITTTKDGMRQRASAFRLMSLMYFAMVLLHSFQWRMWSNLSEFLENVHP